MFGLDAVSFCTFCKQLAPKLCSAGERVKTRVKHVADCVAVDDVHILYEARRSSGDAYRYVGRWVVYDAPAGIRIGVSGEERWLTVMQVLLWLRGKKARRTEHEMHVEVLRHVKCHVTT